MFQLLIKNEIQSPSIPEVTMKKSVLVLLLLISTIFGAIDTIIDGTTNIWLNSFQLWENNGDLITYFRTINHVENSVIFGNQKIPGDAIKIIDAKEKVTISNGDVYTIGTIPRPGSNSAAILPVKKFGDTLIFTDSTDLLVYDIKDPANPVELYKTIFPAEIKEIIWYKPDTLFVLDNRSIIEKAFHITSYTGSSAPKIESSFQFVSRGYGGGIINPTTYISLSSDHITIWDIPITEVIDNGKYQLPGVANGLEIVENRVYASIPKIGTIVYNFTNEKTFEPVDTLDGGGASIVTYKNLLITGGGGDSVRIFDISNPNAIEHKAIFTEQSFGLCMDSVKNHLYSISPSGHNWIDVLDINRYLKTDTTVSVFTTHKITLDTTITIDTNLVDAAPDAIVTTVESETKTDSMFIKTDSLSGGVSFWDTTVIEVVITKTTIDSTVDTLGGSAILTPVEKQGIDFDGLITLNEDETITKVMVMDVRGRVIYAPEDPSSLLKSLTAKTRKGFAPLQAGGVYFMRITTNQRVVMKKVRL